MKNFSISLILFICTTFVQAQVVNEKWIKENYSKKEVMIPMRDGVCLFTAIYEPLVHKEKSPILLFRTPYSISPYGKEYTSQLWYTFYEYTKAGYILVFQDVRGQNKSQGEFIHMRPFNPHKKGQETDEASDAYDTVEWLLKNTAENNGKVGVSGCSYLGFYTLMASLSNHPAIKAICPQAPATDWFMGDDIHHNGALMLEDAFNFLSGVSRQTKTDSYSYFMKMGSIKDITSRVDSTNTFWHEMVKHPHYDSWWKQHNARSGYSAIKSAVLMVGGLFDAEDAYGTWQSYKTIQKECPDTPLYLLVGPWSHNQWSWGNITYLGNIRFGNQELATRYVHMEKLFFDYYLREKGTLNNMAKATVFFTGENHWKTFAAWPPLNIRKSSLYLRENGMLSFMPPSLETSYTEYISDPTKPVPYSNTISNTRNMEYLTDDQRMASQRPDVITFQTAPLSNSLTAGGELSVDLRASISTTDADFIVKLIDVFPEDFEYQDEEDGAGNGKSYPMGGYQMLVRGDVMRGKFRNSFECPSPFIPGKPTTISFQMNDIAHTFNKGHRIMIQIQSTWFPLVNRNPQYFTNIYECEASAFKTSRIKVYHQKGEMSRIILPIILDK